jgi:mannose-6-phosphate isomerase-like protein (cupin superfamily)
MAINLFVGFTNRITGETFRCLSYTMDSFIMKWIVQPKGYVPFEHIHLHQDETFHIQRGELKVVTDGIEQIVGPGESITIKKGQPHIAYNNKPSVLEAVVEYKPGLDQYQFFQCFAGLTIENDLSKNGTINIPKMCYFPKKLNTQCITRPTSIPAPLFSFVLTLFYFVGIVLRWDRLYDKYST